MARNKGTFNFAANFEVLTKAPLDARAVVDSKANLIAPNIWQDDSGNPWVYDGMTVSVIADTPTNNGLYFLTDSTTYTDYNSWIKVNTPTPADSSGTSSLTFQLNNGDNGVVIKDVSGNLEVVSFDGSTYANITAGHINVDSLKVDTLNGVMYATDGSIYAADGTFPLKAFQGSLTGNGITSTFNIDHNLNTLRQTIEVFDELNNAVYPDLSRGINTNIVTFVSPIPSGIDYELIILGF